MSSTPTLAAGKGFGDFDIQVTIGEGIPIHDHSNSGRSIPTNITAQYHVTKLLWPEIEMNRTDWIGGARGERTQTYLTPRFIAGPDWSSTSARSSSLASDTRWPSPFLGTRPGTGHAEMSTSTATGSDGAGHVRGPERPDQRPRRHHVVEAPNPRRGFAGPGSFLHLRALPGPRRHSFRAPRGSPR